MLLAAGVMRTETSWDLLTDRCGRRCCQHLQGSSVSSFQDSALGTHSSSGVPRQHHRKGTGRLLGKYCDF